MMEFLGTVFEIAKNIGEGWEIMKSIIEFYGSYSGLEESMQNLKRKVECLSAQEHDINTQICSEEHRPWKKRKTEVEVWRKDEQQMKNDMQRLEQQVVGERNFFLRVRLRKRIIEKTREVEELQKRGRAFNDLLVDEVPTGKLLMPLTEDFVKSTKARNVERILECLMNDKDRRIGVFGRGGIGKTTIMTHIQNHLVETDMFDAVFWVTVCKPFNIKNLQRGIAKELDFNLSDKTDVTRRAKELYAVLSRWKRYILILDDLRKAFTLESVGIPKPTRSNGCKLLLTTRLSKVCRRMDCKTVKMGLLTEQEAQTLFLRKAVSNGTVLAPEVENFATQIAKECAGLPLTIVTVAGSLRGLKRTHEWKNALNELISSTKGASDGESEVIQRLRFSYSHLGDKVLQDCFLYCSLYPEDHAIPIKELLELWMAEGYIADRSSVEAQVDEGHTIMQQLRSVGFVESSIDQDGHPCVRVHDLIRDMARRITGSSPRFMVRAGEGHESIPYEEWSEDLEKISLMGSRIRELPVRPPFCPRLTTMLLNAIGLKEIPDSLFTNTPHLKVLDLSDNEIKSLPESISNLENLHALMLARCHQLMDVPSLATLKALKVLILTESSIEKVPEGIEDLVNLTKLDLVNNKKLGMFPGWMLRKLLKLRFLRIDGTEVLVRVEDLLFLRELKVVGVQFDNVDGLSRYLPSQQFQGLEKYRLLTGGGIDGPSLVKKEVCIHSRFEPFRSDQLVEGSSLWNEMIPSANHSSAFSD